MKKKRVAISWIQKYLKVIILGWVFISVSVARDERRREDQINKRELVRKQNKKILRTIIKIERFIINVKYIYIYSFIFFCFDIVF